MRRAAVQVRVAGKGREIGLRDIGYLHLGGTGSGKNESAVQPEAFVAKNLRLHERRILAAAQHGGFRGQCPEERAREGNLGRAKRWQRILDMAGSVIGKRTGQAAKGGAPLGPALRKLDRMVRPAGTALIEQVSEGNGLGMFIGHLFRISG